VRTFILPTFILVISLVSFLPVQSSVAQEKSLADQMPRVPGKTPEEEFKTFKFQHDFTVELVASEPNVVDPIDAAFDEHGRMYVVEMSDYPFLPEQRVQKYKDQRAESWSRIRLLTDTNDDGRMDRSVVFADKLRWAQSVCCSKGGVYVLGSGNLYFMKDTTGDGVADVMDVICSGFSHTNVQALANGLEWGRDNAIYFASGLAGGELTIPARDGKPERKFKRINDGLGRSAVRTHDGRLGQSVYLFQQQSHCSRCLAIGIPRTESSTDDSQYNSIDRQGRSGCRCLSNERCGTLATRQDGSTCCRSRNEKEIA